MHVLYVLLPQMCYCLLKMQTVGPVVREGPMAESDKLNGVKLFMILNVMSALLLH